MAGVCPMSVPQSVVAARTERINRRLHQRVPIDCQVRLCWQDRQGNHVLHAQAMDLSNFGMLVEAERAIEPGAVVSVETKLSDARQCVRPPLHAERVEVQNRHACARSQACATELSQSLCGRRRRVSCPITRTKGEFGLSPTSVLRAVASG